MWRAPPGLSVCVGGWPQAEMPGRSVSVECLWENFTRSAGLRGLRKTFLGHNTVFTQVAGSLWWPPPCPFPDLLGGLWQVAFSGQLLQGCLGRRGERLPSSHPFPRSPRPPACKGQAVAAPVRTTLRGCPSSRTSLRGQLRLP